MPRILVGAAATAVANNTALSAGDIGVTNEGGMKVGPGNWNSLPFLATATAVQTAISAAVAGLIGGAPGALDALNELAAALGNDANFAATVNAAIAAKATLQSGALASNAAVAPNAAAVATAIAAVGGGAIGVAAGIVIPLDTAGNGKVMAEQTLILNSVFSFAGAVEGGNCNFSLVGDGSHTPNLSAFTLANGYAYNPAAGAKNIYSAVYAYGTPLLYGVAGATVDSTAPTLVSATVADADALRINLVWSEAMNSTVSAAAAFAISAGHTVTTHTYDSPTTSHLTITTPFVQGEAARTLAYTQPGSNKMQDLAGNLLANIASAAITNSVGTPTLVSAIVSNSTPGRIDLTWSEAMNATVSASAAFAVSAGHALTAHTYVDATHSYLTTSAAFVNGEAARTLAYTQPGSNKMQDLGGNLLANIASASITNNVGVAGSLSIGTISYATLNVTSSGFLDWTSIPDDPVGSPVFYRKTAANLIVAGVSQVNLSYNNNGEVLPYTWTTGDSQYEPGGTTQVQSRLITPTDATQFARYRLVFPAGTATRKARLYFTTDRDGGGTPHTGKFTLRATLSDGSAAPTVTSATPADGLANYAYEWTYTAGSASQTLTIDIEIAANDGGQILAHLATYGT